MDIFRNLYVRIDTPEKFAEFVGLLWLGDIFSDVLASAVATATRLGGRAYEGVKVAVKIPTALLALWAGEKLRVPVDILAPVTIGMMGGIGRDLFKMILGLAPETVGSMAAMYVATWIETAFGASGVAPRSRIEPAGVSTIKNEIEAGTQSKSSPEELFK